MHKLTVYGLPITPASRLEELAGASFCISYATRRPSQTEAAIRLVGADQILLIDNGAFSHWRSTGETFTDEMVDAYEAWALELLDRCPNAVAVIPDVIQGTLEQNEELRITSQLPIERSMPVWHLDEPISKLLHLCCDYNWIAFGSTIDKPGSPKWHARIKEAFAAIDAWELESDGAYIRPRVHMMRAQAFAHLYPFDSSDSTNVAVNFSRQEKLGETLSTFVARINGRIQASAGPEAEHQRKRPIVEEEHDDDEDDLTLPDYLDRKLNGYTPAPLPRNISWKVKNPNKIVWPTERQIQKAIRKRERERREDAASKLELGSMRIRRGQ